MAEFKWDTEEEIGEVVINEYQKRIIKLCTLNGEEYINVIKVRHFKGKDNIVGGWTEKVSTIAEICSMYNDKTNG